MTWKEIKVGEQRKLFIQDFQTNNYNISELCRIYGISRPTAYLWINRFEEEGQSGLVDRISTPHNQPLSTPQYVINEIIKLKSKMPKWGPKKIHAELKRNKPDLDLPSRTTIGNILKRNGLVIPRSVRKRFAARTHPLAHVKEINDVWSADFKGWFMTKDGYRCEPFTLTDNASRYLLKCVQLQANNENHVWAILDLSFREYGLPLYLRTDNGPPFATVGIGRLSTLAVKLIKAGVMPDFIDPGKPQQNGRHERMHGTLKSEGINSEYSLKEQILYFDKFKDYYNFERPHESINQETPGSVYRPSNRTWNGKLKSPEYLDGYKKAKVEISGQIKLKGKHIYIGRALAREYIGLKEVENGFEMYYGNLYLGDVSENGEITFQRREGRIRKKIKSDFY